MRKQEIISRTDFVECISKLDGDTQNQLFAELHSWGPTHQPNVEITVDSHGRIDSQSSPRPAD